MFALRRLAPVGAFFVMSACSIPPLVMDQDPSMKAAPSGPSVAAVLANIKCELWEAANDTNELPYFLDVPGIPLHSASQHPTLDRRFTLKNLFSEIEYVAELKLTLETMDSGALNPSVNFITPLSPATTNITTAVGGQIFESSDRVFNLYHSIDFQRMVSIQQHPLWKGFRVGGAPFSVPKNKDEPPKALMPYDPAMVADEWSPCPSGLGLHGRLGLKEDLATSAIAARMQDVGVVPSGGTASPGTFAVYGQTPGISGFNGYAFGEMDTTINFTINLDLNAGPNWTLLNFKGPNVSNETGVNGQGLLNVSRWKKDSVQLTIIPVCIRPKYFPTQWAQLKRSDLKAVNSSSSFSGTLKGDIKNGAAVDTKIEIKPLPTSQLQLPAIKFPVEYEPEMGFGTPVWANYLPPCLSPEGQAAIASAPSAAKSNLQLQSIDNLLRTQRR